MSEVPNNRLFVGNLTSDTTADDLRSAFGEVKDAGIVTRGLQSLGYGYVDFSNSSLVNDAIEKFKDLKIRDREVQFEAAKDTSFQCTYAQLPKRERRPRNENAQNENKGNNDQTQNENKDGDNQNGPPRRRRNRNRNNRKRNDDQGNNDGTNNNNNVKRERPPRIPREKVPSLTTLHVANLPQSFGDDDLMNVF